MLRLLGDPETRYREDPVRMLRAARFSAKLGFGIDPGTAAPIDDLGSLLADVPPARLFEETLKLFLGGTAVSAFERLRQFGLFAELFPETERCLSHEEHAFPLTLVRQGLENTDERIRQDKPVTPAFLFAVLLWEPVRQRAAVHQTNGEAPYTAIQRAASEVLSRQLERVALPRRFSTPMQEIWSLQPRFAHTRGKRPQRLLSHPRFRAAYDFLLLRAQSGEADPKLSDWWTEYQANSEDAPVAAPAKSTRRRRGGRRRRRKPAGAGGE